MNLNNIKIVDIRNYTGSKSDIISVDNEEILYSKEVEVDGIYYICIYCYKIKIKKLEEVYRYKLKNQEHETEEYEFNNQYFRVNDENITIIKTHLKSSLEVEVIDKKSKLVKSKHYFDVEGEVTSIPITINSRYFIFYTESGDLDTTQDSIYLCDLLENSIHLIRDSKIKDGLSVVHGLLDIMPTFIHDGEEYLIFNETYMDDYEYELYVYEWVKSEGINKDRIKEIEALYLISVNDFTGAIKNGEHDIPFIEVKKRHLNGWVRYIFMDEKNIYFREKDFDNQIEKIYSLDKSDFKTKTVKEIDHRKIEGRLFYGDIVYEKIESQNFIYIKGIYNCDYELSFKNDMNTYFCDFIGNRYLVTNQWIEDKEENYFEFVYIVDTKENNCNKYDGTCRVHDDIVVLYDNSGYFE